MAARKDVRLLAKVTARQITDAQNRLDDAIRCENWARAATQEAYKNGLQQVLIGICLEFGLDESEFGLL